MLCRWNCAKERRKRVGHPTGQGTYEDHVRSAPHQEVAASPDDRREKREKGEENNGPKSRGTD